MRVYTISFVFLFFCVDQKPPATYAEHDGVPVKRVM